MGVVVANGMGGPANPGRGWVLRIRERNVGDGLPAPRARAVGAKTAGRSARGLPLSESRR
jgi:hypothetical protein